MNIIIYMAVGYGQGCIDANDVSAFGVLFKHIHYAYLNRNNKFFPLLREKRNNLFMVILLISYIL